MDELKLDETALKLLNIIEEKDTAIKELSNRVEGYYTCTKFLLERISSNLVPGQVPSAEDNLDYYEKKFDKSARRTDLLETNLNHYFHK